MGKRVPSQEVLERRLMADDDGLDCREIGAYALEKLAINSLYLEAFARACRTAREAYYVDGMSGPGLGRVRDFAEPAVAYGSPLLALRTEPALTRCILIENDATCHSVLCQRVAPYGGRAVVVRGDVNRDLVPLIGEHVPSWAPCFCFLDPESNELHWSTLQGLAALPRRKRKPELMILYPTNLGWIRQLPRHGNPPRWAIERMNRWFPDRSWQEIYTDRVNGEIETCDATDRYMQRYRCGIKQLGYKHVEVHPITYPSVLGGKREIQYHLIFATDHDAGYQIMKNVFNRGYALDGQRWGMRSLFHDY